MTSIGLAPDELKQLELLRSRFSQLSNSLDSLQNNISYSNPLPNQESLQNSASILLRNLESIQEITTEYSDLFQRIAVHPSTNFPGRTHEHIALHLLRKKLEPDIESKVEEARRTAREAAVDASKLGIGRTGGGYGGDDEYGLDADGEVPGDPFNEMWADIRDSCQDAVVKYIQTQAREPYTVEEQEMGTENVRTGLKRSLEEDSEDEDEEDEDGEGGQAGRIGAPGAKGVQVPGIEPEQVLWFGAKGDMTLPAYVEVESQRKKKDGQKRAPPGR